MRMRTKKWARPELAVCPFYIKNSRECRGKWKKAFKNPQNPIRLELGCGKGGFISQAAAANPNINFIAVDLSSDMLGITKRKLEAACENNVENALITWQNIEQIDLMLSPEDEIERIYINFCNPWFKPSQYKKRLTHARQLLKYREFLADGGEIRFKTDDDELFEHSLRYFAESGFETVFMTRDLHSSGFEDDYKTEHEEMYSSQGIKIKFIIVKKTALCTIDKS